MRTRKPEADDPVQAAVVRSLWDEFERESARGDAEPGLRAQLLEELARMGRGVVGLDVWV
jgi:hypothetical protein